MIGWLLWKPQGQMREPSVSANIKSDAPDAPDFRFSNLRMGLLGKHSDVGHAETILSVEREPVEAQRDETPDSRLFKVFELHHPESDDEGFILEVVSSHALQR